MAHRAAVLENGDMFRVSKGRGLEFCGFYSGGSCPNSHRRWRGGRFCDVVGLICLTVDLSEYGENLKAGAPWPTEPPPLRMATSSV